MSDSPLPGASHVVALDTYGTQKVLIPATKQHVTALKCTRAVPDILEALFGARAINVTPPGASYHYVQLTAAYHLKQSYLLLKLTDDELAQVETLTRQQPLGAWVYLWRDGHWLEFPCGSHADYRLASATSSLTYPRFSPSGAQAICPSTLGTTEGSTSDVQLATGHGLTIKHSGDWWWIGRDTYAHRETLKAAGARWSKTHQQWYVIGAALPRAIQALTHPTDTPSDAEASTALPTTDNAVVLPRQAEVSAVPAQPRSIEVVQDEQPSTSEVRVDVQPSPVALTSPNGNGGGIVVPQSYVGRVNVVGDCYCFGVVLDRRPPTYKNIPIYLSVAGPATSVEALWAKLSQGKETAIVPDDRSQSSIYLEPNKAGLYVRHQKKIDWLGIDHLILLHEDLAAPRYPSVSEDKEPATTYILCLSEEQRLAKLGEHVRKTVKVAVFDRWFTYLERQGRQQGLVRDCAGHGVQVVAVRLDGVKWTAIITDGLRTGQITLV